MNPMVLIITPTFSFVLATNNRKNKPKLLPHHSKVNLSLSLSPDAGDAEKTEAVPKGVIFQKGGGDGGVGDGEASEKVFYKPVYR